MLYIREATWEDSGYYICEGIDTRGTTIFQVAPVLTEETTVFFQFVANLVIAEALQIRLEPQQQTVSPIQFLIFRQNFAF